MSELNNLFSDLSCLSPTDLTALEEYKKSINILSDRQLNLEFNNKDQFHAALVVSDIFRTAEHSLKIFTGSFSGEISNQPVYLEELKKAIKNNSKSVEVIFQETPNESSLCLKALRELKKEGSDILLYVLDKEYNEAILVKHFNNTYGHFTLGDDRMFRYETDKIKFKAFCNFDDKSTVESLANTFSIFKLNSTPLN